MSKRDFIFEIISKKNRLGSYQDSPEYLASSRLYDLKNNLPPENDFLVEDKTINSLFIVGIASCIEVSVRNTIKRFIDSGSPYIERVSNYKDLLRFDLNIVLALHDKRVTFGEFVSHLVPISNIEQILSSLSIILEKDVKHALSEVREFQEPSDEVLLGSLETEDNINKVLEEGFVVQSPLLVPDVDVLISSIKKLFEIRHIAAHEAKFDTISYRELNELFEKARIFIDALFEITEQTLFPISSRNAWGISMLEAKRAEKIKRVMEQLSDDILNKLPNKKFADGFTAPKRALKKANAAFEKYLNAEIEFEESIIGLASGNTLDLIAASNTYSLSKERSERLNMVLKYYEL